MKRAFLCMLMALVMSCAQPGEKEKRPTYRIGYMVCNSSDETLRRFRPLTAFLGKELGVNFEAVAIDTLDFSKHVGDLDFTHTNSLLYIIMHRHHGVEIIAAEKAGSLGAKSRGSIAVLKKSGFRDLKDLKGKSMVFGPMFAPTGYMSQVDLMLKAGLDPADDLAFFSIPAGSFKHEKVIYSVLFGKFHAGAFPMLDFERMVRDGKIEADDFLFLAEGEIIPYCNFAATQKIEEAFVKKFKRVLLNIKEDDTVEIDGEVVKVLERANIDGYEDVKDEDFEPLREMAKRTNMPPYQTY